MSKLLFNLLSLLFVGLNSFIRQLLARNLQDSAFSIFAIIVTSKQFLIHKVRISSSHVLMIIEIVKLHLRATIPLISSVLVLHLHLRSLLDPTYELPLDFIIRHVVEAIVSILVAMASEFIIFPRLSANFNQHFTIRCSHTVSELPPLIISRVAFSPAISQLANYRRNNLFSDLRIETRVDDSLLVIVEFAHCFLL